MHIYRSASISSVKCYKLLYEIHTKFTHVINNVRCPAGYSLYSQSCGRFCYRYEANACKDWDNARATCQAEGGDLLVPTECNYQYFREQAETIVGICDSEFWLGAQRPTNGADFITVEGDTISNTANFWKQGQPDNTNGTENCLEMRRDYDLLANDLKCSQLSGYICQVIL
ncbi:hypothetical protein ACJMK2_038837 [Sinanodonta woodiana]|uniref:C-type lectin domain-containing protein n=1 Tax=Sinanodonta woodiana TaxID=1069815 RepID=A0ABD3WA71_SINWO